MLREGVKWNHIKCLIKIREVRRRGRKKIQNKCDEWKVVTNMVDINPTISVIALNVNVMTHHSKYRKN